MAAPFRPTPGSVLILTAVVLAIVLVPFTGGDLSKLAHVKVRGWPLLSAALLLQVLIMTVWPQGPVGLLRALHVASYIAAFAVIWMNRRLPGLWWVGAGALLNFVAIVANGGVMPASAAALRSAGINPESGEFANSTVVGAPRLGILGDAFAVPEWVPLANVFSVGDVCIAVGAALLVHASCRLRAPEEPESETVVTFGQRIAVERSLTNVRGRACPPVVRGDQ